MPKGVTRGEYEPRPPEQVFHSLMNSNLRLNADQMRLLSRSEHWERETRIAGLNPKELSIHEREERERAMKAIAMRKRLGDPKYREERNHRTSTWRRNHPEKVKASSLEWSNKTKDKRCRLKRQSSYQDKNRERASTYRKVKPEKYRSGLKEWRSRNPNYSKERYRSDLRIRLLAISRARIRDFIEAKGDHKSSRTATYLGCGSKEFLEYISSKFAEGMTTEKILKGEIDIHHRIPPSRIMQDNPKLFLKSLHYTNTEPMWRDENRKRSNFIWPDVALEAISWGINLKPFEVKRALNAGIKLPKSIAYGGNL